MRKITTTAGTSFLVWFLFSPVIGFYFFFKTYGNTENATILPISIYILLTYFILGIIGYFIVKYTSGIFIEKYTPSEWDITFDYVTTTCLISNIVGLFVLIILDKISLTFISLIVNPLIFWGVIMYVAHSLSPVPNKVVTKSIYLVVIVNILFVLSLKFLINQMHINIYDFALILNLIIFYFATKKYLLTSKTT